MNNSNIKVLSLDNYHVVSIAEPVKGDTKMNEARRPVWRELPGWLEGEEMYSSKAGENTVTKV